VAFGSKDDGGVAAQDDGREQRDERQKSGLIRSENDDDASGFGSREIEMGTGDRIYAAKDLGIFIGPTGVIDKAIDAVADFILGVAGRDFGGADDFFDEFAGAILEHFGCAIENLAAKISGFFRPTVEG